MPYGNGAADHELEKIAFGEESIVIDGPPVPRSPDHAAAAAGYKVCYHPSLLRALYFFFFHPMLPDLPPPCPSSRSLTSRSAAGR